MTTFPEAHDQGNGQDLHPKVAGNFGKAPSVLNFNLSPSKFALRDMVWKTQNAMKQSPLH